MAFRVGQRVCCIDDSGWEYIRSLSDVRFPVKDEVYTVRQLLVGIDGREVLRLLEIKNGLGVHFRTGQVAEPFFSRTRFRPVVSTTTGMAVLEQIRRDVSNKTSHKIREDA